MDNKITLIDTIAEIHQTIEVNTPQTTPSEFQKVYYGAMIVIALANVALVLFIFLKNKSFNSNLNEQTRRINLLKTLVLDFHMKEYYLFFKNIKSESKKLLQKGLTPDQKTIVNENIKDLAKEFREEFTDIFIAIDENLYKKILAKTDELVDNLTENIFDEGINLSHEPKFKELISVPLNKSRTDIVKVLFSYSG